MAGKFSCPKCGSENTQSCQVIYQQGTVGHSYKSTSGDYSVETSGTESTALAQSVAPPAKKETHWLAVLFFGFFTYGSFSDGFFWLGVILALLTARIIYVNEESTKYNEKQWPIEYERWQRSYLCHRCGNLFIIK